METTGKIEGFSVDFRNNQAILTLKIDCKEFNSLQKLKGLKLNIKMSKWYQKRKIDCNAYMWVLIQKIAENLSTPEATVTKEEVYREAIRNVGAYKIVPIKNEAVSEWIRIWSSNGIGWICDTMPSNLKGFTNIICYHGSSVYNQKEMNRLVNVIKQECSNLGIETIPQNEMDELLEEWE